jgi:DNA-binding CsgD family transcriptional regulator
MEEQLKWAINIISNEELNISNEKVFESNMTFLRGIPQSDHHKYLFSNVFKVKSAKGELKQVLQRGTYITAKESGLPLYSLGILLDISNLKFDDLLTLSVEKILDGNGIFNTRNISYHFLYPDEFECLTQQEKKVARLLAEGYSSKQIASKLFLSEHTIISHRKNLLKKTNTKNVAQLIAFSIKNKLI